MPDREEVCVIGAGPSGLAVAKALVDRDVPFDWFEQADRVGGNWAFGNRDGHRAIYRSLHINTSRDRMAYADFPMPADYPDFPHHTLMGRYFAAYARRFRLDERVTLSTKVVRTERPEPGRWHVTLGCGSVRRYRALVVANGHHWDPRWPEPPLPGRFTGDVLHAHDYVSPTEPIDLRGRRVVVVGLGNSAVDIACELCRPDIAARLYLSTRRGAWIIPNYLFGRPMDQLGAATARLPWRLQSLVAELLLRTLVGSPWRFGLPRPDHPPLAAHPTISQDLLVRLGRGDIVPMPGITALDGRSVRFTDGRSVEADVLIYCTGYRVSFPFFARDFLDAPDNVLPLWRRIVRPGDNDLFFVGLVQPLGAVMPIAEAQAKLVAAFLAGAYLPPPARRMQRQLEQEQRRLRRRYVASPRHTLQIDFDRYLRQLARESRAGMRRAAKARLSSSAAASP